MASLLWGKFSLSCQVPCSAHKTRRSVRVCWAFMISTPTHPELPTQLCTCLGRPAICIVSLLTYRTEPHILLYVHRWQANWCSFTGYDKCLFARYCLTLAFIVSHTIYWVMCMEEIFFCSSAKSAADFSFKQMFFFQEMGREVRGQYLQCLHTLIGMMLSFIFYTM